MPDPRRVAGPATAVYAYAAVGEVLPSRAYFSEIPAAWRIGANPAWNSIVVDQAQPEWAAFFVIVLLLTVLLAGSNLVLTLVTVHLGAPYYGYGFACALLVTVMAAAWLLGRKLDTLEYETFMLQ